MLHDALSTPKVCDEKAQGNALGGRSNDTVYPGAPVGVERQGVPLRPGWRRTIGLTEVPGAMPRA
jgi:hypothetical protein